MINYHEMMIHHEVMMVKIIKCHKTLINTGVNRL